MDLSYGPDYEAFRDAVRAFCREHVGRAQDGRTRDPRAWQRLLIEHGYAARTIPKQYGGFGGTPDILKSRIIAEEFIVSGISFGRVELCAAFGEFGRIAGGNGVECGIV